MDTLRAQVDMIERDVQQVNSRLDRHLEIYASNGKELTAVKIALQSLEKTVESLDKNNASTQADQWSAIRTNQESVTVLKIEMGKITTKAAFFAATAAAFMSTVLSIGAALLINHFI